MKIGLTNVEVNLLKYFTLKDRVFSIFNSIDYSIESCGYLFGYVIENDLLLIDDIRIASNHSKENNEFCISIEELHDLNLIHKQRVIGIFHNHLSEYDSTPSFIDRYFISLYPFVWLIATKNNFNKIDLEVCLRNRKLKEMVKD